MPTFDGNPLEYCTFMRTLKRVIENKEPDYVGRLHYLEQHTAGRAQEMVRSCLYMKPKEGYLKAKKLWESKFGRKHKIPMAYVDQVTRGPPSKEEDPVCLEGYSILLTSCTNTFKAIGYSKKLEGPDNMRKIIDRLPPRLQISWRNNADRIINMEGREVCIEDISLFVEQKSRALNDPVFGMLPCLTREKKNSKDKGTKSKGDGPGAKQLSFVTLSDKNPPNPSDKNPPNPVKDVSGPSGSVTNPADSSKNCPFCRETHNLSDCPSFAKVPDLKRFDFVMKQRLCFSCLRGGHQSRGCYKKKPCTHCHGRHATVMHVHPLENRQVQPRPEVGVREAPAESGGNRAQGNVVPTGTQQGSTERFCGLTTMEGSVTALPIVPVKIKVRGSRHCIETCALLDKGSNSTFCSVILLERLRINGKKTRLMLTTMGRSEKVESLIVRDLVVSDLDENVVIPLHEVLSRPVMPITRDEIPRQEDVERWPHLRGHMYLTELDFQGDLLIGADVPEALQPRELIPAIDGGPYATRVDFGWVINGPTGRKPKYVPSSCFFVKSVQAHSMCVACANFHRKYW